MKNPIAEAKKYVFGNIDPMLQQYYDSLDGTPTGRIIQGDQVYISHDGKVEAITIVDGNLVVTPLSDSETLRIEPWSIDF